MNRGGKVVRVIVVTEPVVPNNITVTISGTTG